MTHHQFLNTLWLMSTLQWSFHHIYMVQTIYQYGEISSTIYSQVGSLLRVYICYILYFTLFMCAVKNKILLF